MTEVTPARDRARGAELQFLILVVVGLAAFAYGVVLAHDLMIFAEARATTQFAFFTVDPLKFFFFPEPWYGVGRGTTVGTFKVIGAVCGMDAGCTNDAGAIITALGSVFLVFHTRQVTASIGIALVAALLWVLSGPLLGMALWQATWADSLSFLTSLVTVSFWWAMLGRPVLSPRARVAFVVLSLLLVAVAFNAKESSWYLIGILPIMAVLRGSRIDAVRRNLVLSAIPLAYAAYYIAYALTHAVPEYAAQVSGTPVVAGIMRLLALAFGLDPRISAVDQTSPAYDRLHAIAIVGYAIWIVAVIAAAAVAVAIRRRTWTRPTLAGFESEIYLVATAAGVLIINARSLGIDAYYMTIPYWALIVLAMLLMRRIAAGLPRFAFAVLVVLFTFPQLAAYASDLTERSAYRQLAAASDRWEEIGAVMRLDLAGRPISSASWRTLGTPQTRYLVLGGHPAELLHWLLRDPGMQVPTTQLKEGTAEGLRAGVARFSAPGEVLVVTADDYRLLLLAYQGEILFPPPGGTGPTAPGPAAPGPTAPGPTAPGSSAPPASGSPGPAPSPSVSPDTLDPLSSPEAFAPGEHATLSSVDDAPPGYVGPSIQASITDLPAGTPSESQRNVSLDLSGYGDAATVKVWFKTTTLTNLRTIYVLFKSANGYAAYGSLPSVAGSWGELVLPKGSPSGTQDMDWGNVQAISIRADASDGGAYTGQVLWRDLRLTH